MQNSTRHKSTKNNTHYLYHNYSRYKPVQRKLPKKKSIFSGFSLVIILLIVFAVPTIIYAHYNSKVEKTGLITSKSNGSPTLVDNQISTTPAVRTQINPCTTNASSNIIIVSIDQRHLWACQGSQLAYQTPVVTGDMNVAADVTPVGTYHIYAKDSNLFLNGSDSRGSWHDYVNYWMPFLTNGYGTFGLHDATWRSESDFGNISPYASNSSHGCVELPLGAAKWLFNWVNVGTTVTIET